MKKIIALLLVLCLLPVLAGCGFAASEPDEEAAKLRVQPLEGEPKEPDTRGLKHYELDNGISFYATGGKLRPITWTRANEDAPFTFTYTDGTPVEMTPGKTFIAVIHGNSTVSYE